ncbi:hypothetical protein [Priestia megaterium]|nr:hypothetical protein [Priestia megaterium]
MFDISIALTGRQYFILHTKSLRAIRIQYGAFKHLQLLSNLFNYY